MANHVTSVLEIEFASAEDAKRFSEWIAHYPIDESITYGERLEKSCNTMLQHLYPDLEQTRSYFIDNIGAKWVYFDEIDVLNQSVYMTWESAWSFPSNLFSMLTDHLRKEYPGFAMSCTYEDESFCFIGAAASNDNESDLDEYDFEEELDAYRDDNGFLSDEFFESIWQRKSEILQECIANIQE